MTYSRSTDTTATRRFGAWALAAAIIGGLLAAPAQATLPLSDVPDPTWQTNGRVWDILYVGNTVYIAGAFTEMRPPEGVSGDPVVRNRAAAIDATTGELLPWDPNASAIVYRLGYDPDGGKIYLAGNFTNLHGVAKRRLARVDPATGVPDSWRPKVSAGIRALAVSPDGDTVYVGGKFLTVNDVARTRLAAINASDASLVSGWDPAVTQEGGVSCPPRCFPTVTGLAVSPGGTELFIGGTFAYIDGIPRNSVGAVDLATGEVTDWYPYVSTVTDTTKWGVYTATSMNQVYDISVLGNHVFVCGNYWALGGKPSPNIGAVFADTGIRDYEGWRTTTDGAVNACDVQPPTDTLYIGGHFEIAGGNDLPPRAKIDPDALPRNKVAAVSATDGTVDAWDPGANTKTGLYAVGASSQYAGIGGDFTRTGGGCQPGNVNCNHLQQGFAQYSEPPSG